MSKVYAFLADGLEEVECLGAMDILVRAGVEVTLVYVTGSRQVTGAHGFTITADKLFEETDPAEADVLFLPGGMPGTKNLAAFEPLMEAVRLSLIHICCTCGPSGFPADRPSRQTNRTW